MTAEERSVAFSATTITELMIPAYANFGGKIHGGIILSLMDKAAYACASKHAGTYCVTVAVNNVEFLQPVDVGDLVHLKASVNHVGRTSIVVGIKVIAENVKLGLVKHTNTSYFTMVAKDDDGKLTQVPRLVLEKEDEIRRFTEALQLKKLKSSFNDEFEKAKKGFNLMEEIDKLKDERCTVRLTE
ncbi:MAG: acyl-CoA thioesterase [Bacteroidota bacterium]